MNISTFILPRPASARRDAAMVYASGLLATVVMTTAMLVLPMFGLGETALPLWLARVFGHIDLPVWIARLLTGDAQTTAALAVVLHVTLGFGYAWLFAGYVEPRLALRPTLAGLLFGFSLWLFAQAVAVPVMGLLVSSAGTTAEPLPGWFSMHLGPGAAAASLITHLAYGATLGFVYGCQFGGSCRDHEPATAPPLISPRSPRLVPVSLGAFRAPSPLCRRDNEYKGHVWGPHNGRRARE